MIFFEDGTFLYNFSERNVEYPGNTLRYLEQVSKGVGTKLFYEGFYWGIYRIEGDTIVTQYISNPAYLAPWEAWGNKYKVNDRRIIELIPTETYSLVKTTKLEKKVIAETMAKRKTLPAIFIPSPYIPKPHSWLKKEEWTKCK